MQPTTLNSSGIRYSFKVGDMAVHPAHGVGEVERLEDRDFGGRMTTVYVIKIRDMEPGETIAREMALFKVSAPIESRAEIMQFAEIFRAKIVDVSRRSLTIEVTGSADKIEAFERMIRPFGLIEMVRTGEIAISRGRGET